VIRWGSVSCGRAADIARPQFGGHSPLKPSPFLPAPDSGAGWVATTQVCVCQGKASWRCRGRSTSMSST
jgi:hypothetical protein